MLPVSAVYKKLYKKIISGNADYFTTDTGRTLVHYAIQYNRLDMLNKILNISENNGRSFYDIFSKQDMLGNTPLHYAFEYGDSFFNNIIKKLSNDEFLKLLLIRNYKGYAPIGWAIKQKQADIEVYNQLHDYLSGIFENKEVKKFEFALKRSEILIYSTDLFK
jgi:ankyrin repeat protein